MRRRSTRFVLAGALLALPAAATVVIAQSFEEMAKASHLVVRGTVGQVQSAWNEGHTGIETWAEIRVTEALKGKTAAGSTLMIRVPGGVVGEVGAYVAGAPKFKTGEDTVLFLEAPNDDKGLLIVSGLAAGKITFQRNGLGEVRAVRDLRGIAFYEQTIGTPKYRVLDKPEDLGTPEQFLARIRAAVTAAVPPVIPAVPGGPKGVTR